MLVSLVLFAAPAMAEPLVLNVPPDVVEVVADCGTTKNRYPVIHGHVTIQPALTKECDIILGHRAATLTGGGAYSCTLSGCTKVDTPKTVLEPGVVHVTLAKGIEAMGLEVACDVGYRQRQDVVQHTARFEGVPDEGCTLLVKGGIPAKYRPIRPGAWSCELQGSVLVCSPS